MMFVLQLKIAMAEVHVNRELKMLEKALLN